MSQERRPARFDPTWRFMGLSKYSYKYLNWGYKFFFTLVTKSHEPLSTVDDKNPALP